MASRLTVNRGTTFTINGIYMENGVATNITSCTIRFTVKAAMWDENATDTDALILKNVTSFAAPTTGAYLVTLSATDTFLDPNTYFYDIKIQKADGVTIYRIDNGQFIISGSPTNRTS